MTDRAYTMGQAQDILEECITNPLQFSNRTPFLVGPPGLGKTALAHAVYKKFERTHEKVKAKDPTAIFTHFLPYVAPEREPTEWGLPMPGPDRKSVYMMPMSEFIWQPNDCVFMLIDEIDKANNMMQNVLGRIAHERRVHNIVLPPNSFVVMAGNRTIDRAGGFNPNTHIKGRRTHIPVTVNYKEWIEMVAIPHNLHTSVVSFIRSEPKFLHLFDDKAAAFPSPRAWSKVGEQLHRKMPDHVERALVEGDIGVEAANSFWGHLQIFRNLRDPAEIIRAPDKVKVPEDNPAVMWAEITALARHVEHENADPIFRYFNRVPGEFAFCGYKDVLLRDKIDKANGNENKTGMRVAKTKAGQAWMLKNASLIQSTN